MLEREEETINSTEENDEEQSIANPGGIPKLLLEVGYPASKEDLIDYAQDHDADPTFIGMLENLPDSQYGSPSEVNEALQGKEEQ